MVVIQAGAPNEANSTHSFNEATPLSNASGVDNKTKTGADNKNVLTKRSLLFEIKPLDTFKSFAKRAVTHLIEMTRASVSRFLKNINLYKPERSFNDQVKAIYAAEGTSGVVAFLNKVSDDFKADDFKAGVDFFYERMSIFREFNFEEKYPNTEAKDFCLKLLNKGVSFECLMRYAGLQPLSFSVESLLEKLNMKEVSPQALLTTLCKATRLPKEDLNAKTQMIEKVNEKLKTLNAMDENLHRVVKEARYWLEKVKEGGDRFLIYSLTSEDDNIVEGLARCRVQMAQSIWDAIYMG